MGGTVAKNVSQQTVSSISNITNSYTIDCASSASNNVNVTATNCNNVLVQGVTLSDSTYYSGTCLNNISSSNSSNNNTSNSNNFNNNIFNNNLQEITIKPV